MNALTTGARIVGSLALHVPALRPALVRRLSAISQDTNPLALNYSPFGNGRCNASTIGIALGWLRR